MDPNNQNIDATNVFGVKRPLSTKEEQFHRELERRSLDIIRIKNPDIKDFFVEWDKRYWRVPALGTLDVPRYIAIKYCKDKAVDTINNINEKMHTQEVEERMKKGLPPFESKWHEEQATYAQPRYPKTNDKEVLSKLYKEYWVGMVYEYGKDQPQQIRDQATEELDMTPIELRIIRDLENRRVDMTSPEPQIKEPIKSPKEKLAKEVTVENGEPKTEKSN